MEDEMGIIKDEKPYLIFKCKKCEQYMYVKPSQKTKKCLRCGKANKVPKLNIVAEVKGMSAAVKKVKKLQNELSLEQLGDLPNLEGNGGFSIASSQTPIGGKSDVSFKEDKLQSQFYSLLKELSKHHSSFPKYIIELMAKEYKIKKEDLSILIKQFIREGILISLDHNYYRLC